MGMGRVCGTSASSAPIVTTVVTPSRSAMSSSSRQNVRQRIDGSIPCTRTTRRPLAGTVTAVTVVVGHVISRRPSSEVVTTGRLTWKSWYSSGSIAAISSAPQTSCRCRSAAVAAPPASFHPSNAASITACRGSSADDGGTAGVVGSGRSAGSIGSGVSFIVPA